ncbi:alkaline phosphatase family protein [uncultured Kriegella sp.]|uniref:alkaline phosphatase family protein n=1 Tax=uncultured Kriegella sp. TaxID=1798910 RepID=UPI0030DA93D9|tara:strand:+ start:126009 stop:127280 length:1272 start_codon:yes stop_codon:yes gene_type:complete
MIRIRQTILLIVIAFCVVQCGADSKAKKPKIGDVEKKVVFVIIDGIAADMLKNVNTPNLDDIAEVGGFAEAYVGGERDGYSETPTISAVGYNSLLTGVWANKHNVFGNEIKAPNYRYPTIFRVFKDNFPMKKTAIFSTWLDNRTKLIGEGLPETKKIKMNYAFDGFELDTINFPHDSERTYIKKIDEKVAIEAARYIESEGPDMSWVYLEFSDDMGHKFGDSPELNAAIEFEDRLMGKIWDAVQERERSFNEDWLVVVTTDHGRSAKDGKGHGGQSDRERSTWIITNAMNTNTYFKEEKPAIVDITPTILRFMNLEMDDNVLFELDGVPLFGEVDAIGLKAKLIDDGLEISWKNRAPKSEQATLYLTSTNDFAKGGQDQYEIIGEVLLEKERLVVPLDDPSGFYKIVLKTPNTILNTWHKTEE